MAIETFDSKDINSAFYVDKNGVSTRLIKIYAKIGTGLPQLFWASGNIIEIDFTYYKDYWGTNETTEKWTLTSDTKWEEICKADKLRFYYTDDGAMVFCPSVSTVSKSDFEAMNGYNLFSYIDNGATITYVTDRISYWIVYTVEGNNDYHDVFKDDTILQDVNYVLLPRVRVEDGMYDKIVRVKLGNNEIEVKETTIGLFVCQENGLYRIIADSDNAYLGYMLDSDNVDGNGTNSFEVELTANDNLQIICSTQDFSSETYNLLIEKVE